MSVPNIKPPPGTPRFLLDGHGIELLPAHANVKMALGHSRTRRITTADARTVSVSWFLSAAQLEAIDNWYHIILRSGERQFAAEVLTQGLGVRWWTARWIQYEVSMRTKNRGRLSGTIFLTGEPTAVAPSGVALSLSVTTALRDVRSSLSLPTDLSLSVSADLLEDYT